jgi:Zn finger protein HypA/HybF involved in hydrogenase expression
MNKLSLLVVLLTFALPPLAIHSQETDPAASAPQEAPAKPPARRPKMPNVITFESSVGNVSFPHKVHQRMGCQKCHHQIHAKDLETPHDEYLTYSWVNCRDCHDESQNHSIYYGCAKCHHSNLENIADETLSAKVVVHKSCWKCHLSGTGVEASERCSFCHEKEQAPLQTSQGSASPGKDAGMASAEAAAK